MLTRKAIDEILALQWFDDRSLELLEKADYLIATRFLGGFKGFQKIGRYYSYDDARKAIAEVFKLDDPELVASNPNFAVRPFLIYAVAGESHVAIDCHNRNGSVAVTHPEYRRRQTGGKLNTLDKDREEANLRKRPGRWLP